MEIRPLLPTDDRMALSRIYEESWKFAYKGLLPQAYLDGIAAGRWAAHADRAGMHTLVAKEGKNLIGTASFCASRFPAFADSGEIVSIYFLPAYIGKGHGAPLLNAACAGLKALGFCDVFLWVLEENVRARQFYEKAGFVCSGQFLDDTIGGKALREVQYCRRLT